MGNQAKMDRAVVGVICEYDPFHLGHARQLELIRQALPNALILCVMSGCFTQRGMPALLSPAFRAQAALRAGADCVLELPCAFAVRDAENFALGGIGLLASLGFVTHVSFGAEGAPQALRCAADLLEAPDEALARRIAEALAEGQPLAAAKGRALAARFPEHAEAFCQPNNLLAMCYLRALRRLQSDIQPLIVRREGDYHAQGLETARFAQADTARVRSYPSATAVRAAYLRGDVAGANAACGYELPLAPRCLPTALDSVLMYVLRSASSQSLAALPDCTEGLENRLFTLARAFATRDELLAALKTRRYLYTRLSRLCCHAMLGMTDELLRAHPAPEYARLLALNAAQTDMRELLAQSRLPIVSKAADGDLQSPLYQLDMRAYDLWALGAGVPAGMMLTQQVQIAHSGRD